MFQFLLQTLSIYYTTSYFFLLLLLIEEDADCILILLLLVFSPEGDVVGGTLVLILRSGGRGELVYPVIKLGVEKSCKLELKMALMATLNTFKHKHCSDMMYHEHCRL